MADEQKTPVKHTSEKGTGPGEGSSSATSGPVADQVGQREAGTNDSGINARPDPPPQSEKRG